MKTRTTIFSLIVAILMLLPMFWISPGDVYAAEQVNSSSASQILMAKVTSVGSRNLVITWTKVNDADGYDISIFKCGDGALKKVSAKTINGNKTFKWEKKNLKKNKGYKVIIRAWVKNNGSKKYLKTTPWQVPRYHVYTSGGTKKYTNPKSITLNNSKLSLNEGEEHWIKAKVNKLQKGKKLINHTAKLRYFSTDTAIAKVSTTGKIVAVSKGSCKIYVYAANGIRKTVSVIVN